MVVVRRGRRDQRDSTGSRLDQTLRVDCQVTLGERPCNHGSWVQFGVTESSKEYGCRHGIAGCCKRQRDMMPLHQCQERKQAKEGSWRLNPHCFGTVTKIGGWCNGTCT